MSRLDDLKQFYRSLDRLAEVLGKPRRLSECSGRMSWPQRGVYFFMEPGEVREQTGHGPRIVRVGTHALKAAANSTLWKRLRQHKGQKTGSGRHRASIFRGVVGSALIQRDSIACSSWDLRRKHVSRADESAEVSVEHAVSKTIGAMEFLWLAVEDDAGPDSQRGFIERNAIALLSNYDRDAIDPPSPSWLGRHCDRGGGKYRSSGLWNSDHVDEIWNPAFLDTLEDLIARMSSRG